MMQLADNVTITRSTTNHADYPGMEPNFFEPVWYAVYTNANHEKRVTQQLELRSIEHFLPLYESVRRWKDRRIRLQMPLFPGYVFTRLAWRDRLLVLQIPSVVRFVGFNGLPAALPDEEMEILRSGLSQRLRAEPHPFLTLGRRVRIKSGSLQGLEGILLRRKSNSRVVLSVPLIHRSIAVDVDSTDLEEILKA
jgi:transcription termination/antitermination protein NusG